MKHKLFATTPEGDTLPGNCEAGSGCFVTKEGKVYDYRVERELPRMVPKGLYTLGESSYFKEVSERVFYDGDPEYFPAKKGFEERLRRKLQEEQ